MDSFRPVLLQPGSHAKVYFARSESRVAFLGGVAHRSLHLGAVNPGHIVDGPAVSSRTPQLVVACRSPPFSQCSTFRFRPERRSLAGLPLEFVSYSNARFSRICSALDGERISRRDIELLDRAWGAIGRMSFGRLAGP